MLYQGMKDKIISDYLKENPIDISDIQRKMVEDGLIESVHDFDKKENEVLKDSYMHSYVKKVGEEYFERWVQSLVEEAEIEYVYN